jgi:polyhydroxyalkanoate synthase
MDWVRYVSSGCPDDPDLKPVAPPKTDRRFTGPEWQYPAFAAAAQAFLLTEELAEKAARDVPGLAPSRQASMAFLTRQFLDAVSPSNFPMTNPTVLARTLQTGGANIQHGLERALRDVTSGVQPAKAAEVGKDVATTPGKVVYRNHLIELIQYEPATDQVHPEPVLIVPAWIMKYYILDLSPGNSLVRHLTEQGFTVFMISWRNPTADESHYGMQEYLDLGPRAALDVIADQTGVAAVHAAGYCLGGTLLSIAAAAMARDGDNHLASMTLLAAQTDFSEPGELSLFIDESQVSFLEDVMHAQGYLDASQMMSAFQMMRSNDLIWSQMIRKYLLGEEDVPMNDLMSWNADTTRMPARMHSEYLRHMFLNNDLAAGRYHVDGHHISLRDIRTPVFAVGTETDHIAPWTSVFKIHNLAHADVTFALTNGGHNAGVLSEPGHRHRHYRLHTVHDKDTALSAEDWMEAASLADGSWWPAWAAWLADKSGPKVQPPKMGKALAYAPGTYVFQE